MQPSRMRLAVVIAALSLVAFVAAGCGGDSSKSDAKFNGTDVAWAAQMVPHHMHAVEMAQLAVDKSPEPKIKQLARGIIATQRAEITKLEGYLKTFGAKPAEPAPAVMTLNEGVIQKLKQSRGANFDQAFLEAMSAHHSSAIDMADIELSGGEFSAAKQLAAAIKKTQLAEIAEMQGLMGATG